MRRLIALGAILFVAACSTSPIDEVASSAPPPPAPPSPAISEKVYGTAPTKTSPDPARQGALVQPGLNSRQFVIPASQLLPRDRRYEPLLNGAPTAVILLDRGNSGRNKAVCEGFTQRMASAETAQQLEPDAVVVLTFWPIVGRVANNKDCKQLLGAYDYERAYIIAQKYSYVEMKMPVLVAIAAPNGQTFAMGMGRESRQRIRSLISGWFTTAVAKSAIGDRYEFYTPSLFERCSRPHAGWLRHWIRHRESTLKRLSIPQPG